MQIRRYRPGEEAALWALYAETTHAVVAQAYTPAQVERWAPADADTDASAERLARTNPLVAVEGGRAVGFAELEPDGHLDYVYAYHEWQGRGVGTALLHAVEAEARRAGLDVLHAEVSLTAAAFFRARGFEVTGEREPVVCGAPAKQYLMRKRVGTSGATKQT